MKHKKLFRLVIFSTTLLLFSISYLLISYAQQGSAETIKTLLKADCEKPTFKETDYGLYKKCDNEELKLQAKFPINNQYIENLSSFEGYTLSTKEAPNLTEITIGEQQLYYHYTLHPNLWLELCCLALFLISVHLLLTLLLKLHVAWQKRLLTLFSLFLLAKFGLLLLFKSELLTSASVYASSSFLQNLASLLLLSFFLSWLIQLLAYEHRSNKKIQYPLALTQFAWLLFLLYSIVKHGSFSLTNFYVTSTSSVSILFLLGITVSIYVLFAVASNFWKKKTNIQKMFAFSVLVSVLIGIVYLHNLDGREKQNISFLQQKLVEGNDPAFEYQLNQNLLDLEKHFAELSSSDSSLSPFQFIKNNFTSGAFSRYDVLEVNTKEDAQSSEHIFTFQKKSFGLQPKVSGYPGGFPELLQDSRWQINTPPNTFYAKYYNKRLVKTNNIFLFPNQFNEQTNWGNFITHIIQEGRFTGVLLTPKKTISSYTSVFVQFFILCLLSLAFLNLPKKKSEWTFRKKMQWAFLSLIVLTALVAVGLTIKETKQQFAENNRLTLEEKVRSVLIEFSHKYAKESSKGVLSKAEIEKIVKKFAAVFFTDITLYSAEGKYIASSQPSLFNKQFLPENLPENILANTQLTQGSIFLLNSAIGNLKYTTAYSLFSPLDKKEGMILSLPSFQQEESLSRQLQTTVMAMVNLVSVFALLAILIALFITNQLLAPIKLISNRISKLELDGTNEPIEYPIDDEIGGLVKAYNHKVEQLEHSAQQLANTERQLAWKEMARQVAHEIKNPLTPLKLNAQMLQKRMEEQNEVPISKFKSFLVTVIEQVNILARIANEFSTFSTIQKAKPQQVNLARSLSNTCELYNGNSTVKVELTYSKENEETTVFIDPDHLQRAIGNLLKNALQAIKGEGSVSVDFKTKKEGVSITISDSGSGIPEEIKPQIFSPNFTTKTGGMGLGLPMVKNIIEQAGGTIGFTSNEKGTRFWICLKQ